MKKFSLLVLSVLLSLSACKKDEFVEFPECLSQFGEFSPENEPFKGEVSFSYFEESKIRVEETEDYLSFQIEEGNKLVFRYEFTKDDSPQIADDEYGEAIYFEVPGGSDQFTLTTSELKKAGGVFGRFCFCADGGFHHLAEGCIHGEKLPNGKWKVALAVKTLSTWEPMVRMISADFEKKDRPIQQ